MPRLVAIDWNDSELRVVAGDGRGASVSGAEVAVITLTGSDGSGRESASGLSDQLKRWVAQVHAEKSLAIVALDRSQVDLHELTLPPAPAGELPELVRFQMQREIGSLDDDAPLDYFILSGGDEAPYRVLAAIVQAELIQEIRSVCESAGLRPRRVVFRPCATASLACRFAKLNSATRIVVHPVGADVDMAVLRDGSIQSIRSVRLPSSASGEIGGDTLVQELRRTIAAARQHAGDGGVHYVTIVSDGERGRTLADRVTSELGVEADVLDPFEVGQPSINAQIAEPPKSSGKFAPLVGMILDESSDESPSLDFLNPRRGEAPHTNTRTYVLAGTVLALLLGWYGVWQYGRAAAIDRQIETAKTQLAQLTPDLESGEAIQDRAERIAQWVGVDAVWLDELDQLSRALRPTSLNDSEYPADADLIAKHVHSELQERSGEIVTVLEAAARSPDAVALFERRIRDAGRQIDIVRANEDSSRPGYPWTFSSRVRVETAPLFKVNE